MFGFCITSLCFAVLAFCILIFTVVHFQILMKMLVVMHVSADARLCQMYICLEEFREHYEEMPFKIR